MPSSKLRSIDSLAEKTVYLAKSLSLFLISTAISIAAPVLAQQAPDMNAYRVPAGNRVAQVNPGGETILPNGRIVAPLGERHYSAHSNLFDITLSPNGKAAVGHTEGGMTIWQRNTRGAIPISISIEKFGLSGAFTHGGAQYIASNGDAGNGISVYDATSWDLPGIDRKSVV
jgi:hypothetical protein